MSYDRFTFQTQDKEILNLLALKNEGRFKQTRDKVLLTLAGCQGDTPDEAINYALQTLSSILARNGTATIADRKTWKKQLLKGECTPYELIGNLKDSIKPKKALSGKSMTRIWTQLSVALELQHQTTPSILPDKFDFEHAYATDAVVPKAEALQNSMETRPAGNYHASRPHLKDSRPGKTNWAEILGNLKEEYQQCAKVLLTASPDNPCFEKAAQQLVWPNQPNPAEAENRRLNDFLLALPARVWGRKTMVTSHYGTSEDPPQSINPPPQEPTPRQKRLFKTTQHKVEKTLADLAAIQPTGSSMHLLKDLRDHLKTKLHPDHLALLENQILSDPVVLASKADLDDFRRIPTPLRNTKELVKWLNPATPDTDFEPVSFTPPCVPAITVDPTVPPLPPLPPRPVAAKFTPVDPITVFLPPPLSHPEPEPEPEPITLEVSGQRISSLNAKRVHEALKKPFLPEVILPLQETSPQIKEWVTKAQAETPEKPTLKDRILEAAINPDETLDLNETFGAKQYTAVHVAAWWGTTAVLEETIQTARARKETPWKVNKVGSTPAHHCKDDEKAAILVKAHAPLDIANNKGISPRDSSHIQTAEKAFQLSRAPQKAQQQQPDLEI